jgi:hypothetical protein
MIPALFRRKLSFPQTSGTKSSEFVLRKWRASSGPSLPPMYEAKSDLAAYLERLRSLGSSNREVPKSAD